MRLRKLGEKGILMGEVSELLIAVLVLAVLIAGGYKIYSNYTINEESEIAKTRLDIIEGKIDLIDDRGDFVLQGVGDDWYLVGFDKGDDEKPDRCLEESCVCVCESSNVGGLVEACNDRKKGICRNVEFDRVDVESYKISLKADLDFKGKDSSGVTRQEDFVSYIDFRNDLRELEIWKIGGDKKTLKVLHFSDDFLKTKEDKEENEQTR
jgi:hypothetical protein